MSMENKGLLALLSIHQGWMDTKFIYKPYFPSAMGIK